RSTRRVFSLHRSPPITGSTMVRRSYSSRIGPVVNRTRPTSRPRADLNVGNPTRQPVRVPFSVADQLSNARARSAKPLEWASLELLAHHGATSSLTWFHLLRSAACVHSTDS